MAKNLEIRVRFVHKNGGKKNRKSTMHHRGQMLELPKNTLQNVGREYMLGILTLRAG
jgi:3-deoxy-D-manno-octulosonic acid (KDO) 8-phosphate synthase